jgi:hypothetical protein
MLIFFLFKITVGRSETGLAMKKRLHIEHPIKGLQSLFSSPEDGLFEVTFLQDFFTLQVGLTVCIAATSGSVTREHTMLRNINAATFINSNIIVSPIRFFAPEIENDER